MASPRTAPAIRARTRQRTSSRPTAGQRCPCVADGENMPFLGATGNRGAGVLDGGGCPRRGFDRHLLIGPQVQRIPDRRRVGGEDRVDRHRRPGSCSASWPPPGPRRASARASPAGRCPAARTRCSGVRPSDSDPGGSAWPAGVRSGFCCRTRRSRTATCPRSATPGQEQCRLRQQRRPRRPARAASLHRDRERSDRARRRDAPVAPPGPTVRYRRRRPSSWSERANTTTRSPSCSSRMCDPPSLVGRVSRRRYLQCWRPGPGEAPQAYSW